MLGFSSASWQSVCFLQVLGNGIETSRTVTDEFNEAALTLPETIDHRFESSKFRWLRGLSSSGIVCLNGLLYSTSSKKKMHPIPNHRLDYVLRKVAVAPLEIAPRINIQATAAAVPEPASDIFCGPCEGHHLFERLELNRTCTVRQPRAHSVETTFCAALIVTAETFLNLIEKSLQHKSFVLVRIFRSLFESKVEHAYRSLGAAP